MNKRKIGQWWNLKWKEIGDGGREGGSLRWR